MVVAGLEVDLQEERLRLHFEERRVVVVGKEVAAVVEVD
jgi:hypothetical protein